MKRFINFILKAFFIVFTSKQLKTIFVIVIINFFKNELDRKIAKL